MFRSKKSRFTAVAAAAAMSLSVVAAPAAAQSNDQDGLVNVAIFDVNAQVPVTVQLPIGIAANVCDVDANVLAVEERTQEGGADCDATNTSTADFEQDLRIADRFPGSGLSL